MKTLSCEVQETVELYCEEGTEAENEENNEEEEAASFPACSKVMQCLDRYHYFSVTFHKCQRQLLKAFLN
jgi:hypothetical protein